MSPAGLGTKTDFTGEGQQQLTRPTAKQTTARVKSRETEKHGHGSREVRNQK
jgi:hypothetical protein